jgi:hypothetical protein
MSTTSERERELRAKYLDWCSARLADRFLALSPDEIYELAERASRVRDQTLESSTPAVTAAESAQPAVDADVQRQSRAELESDTFRALVTRVAEVLADTLPSYEEWAAEYEREPARLDRELLGFWKENLKATGQ